MTIEIANLLQDIVVNHKLI